MIIILKRFIYQSIQGHMDDILLEKIYFFAGYPADIKSSYPKNKSIFAIAMIVLFQK